MPGSATGSFVDAEEYRAELSDINVGPLVLTPGTFTASATRITLRRFHLLRAQESLPRVAFLSLPPERVFISVSSGLARSLIWRGLTLEPGELMLHSPGERLHQRIVGPCCWGFIALSLASLAAACKTATGSTRALPELGRILRPSPGDRQHLLRLHRAAARLAEYRPHLLRHSAVIHAMEQELEGVLMACLTNSKERRESAASRRANEIMVRFEEVLAAHPYQKLRLAEVSRGFGVSDRMIHSFCVAFLGVSPQRYMRLRRLHLVRAAILRADGQRVHVAEIARHAGFTQLGWFAGLYRATFGETPSTTLRRARCARE
jgi:AraC-like DNA-binding protein